MGMTTHVYGFRPPDEKWRAMKAAWDACCTVGVAPPVAVEAFFGGEPPDDAGVSVELGGAVAAYAGDMEEGFEVQVALLPADVAVIRFVNAY